MDFELPEIDEAELEEHQRQKEAAQRSREERIRRGVAGNGVAVDEADVAPEDMPLSEREARWGFSLDELHTATKVVNILFRNPHLYCNDPHLAESGMYTMLSRDRSTKRNAKEALKNLQNARRNAKERAMKEEDEDTLRKTRMKQERDAVLNAMMLPDGEDDVKLITDKPPAAQESPATPTPEGAGGTDGDALKMNRIQKCHTCKSKFDQLHHYYYSMCPPCADFNYMKRIQTLEGNVKRLKGKVVLLTGCRIKIGYAMAVSLLRCGAVVLGTSRFVHDAIDRFMEEPDYAEWSQNLHLFTLDLRDMWIVTQFCAFVSARFPQMYAIINNAAQTIQRTPEYTRALRQTEMVPPERLKSSIESRGETSEWLQFFGAHSSVTVGHPLQLEHHPEQAGQHAEATEGSEIGDMVRCLRERQQKDGKRPVHDRYDYATEATDKRSTNSWTMNMAEVQGSEAAEVMAINALSPFIINARLKPLLLNREGCPENEKRFIVNVSAMEGQFYRYKQTTHPHTNMAKAALNMMTRTSAADYAKDGIYMNSVDTGWITDESPITKKELRARSSGGDMLCPLDEVDAAARCLDPIYTDSAEHGKFFKDFKEIAW